MKTCNTIINETGRWFIHLATLVEANKSIAVGPISIYSTISVVREELSDKASQLSCVSAFGWSYTNVGTICRERATRAEAGALLVDGKRLQAEAYLREWRKAIALNQSYESFLSEGMHIVATVSKPTAFLEEKETARLYPNLLQQRDSKFVVKSDETEWVWRIPIRDVQSLHAFAHASEGWVDNRIYQGNYTPSGFEVGQHAAVAAQGDQESSATSSVSVAHQADLFEVAV